MPQFRLTARMGIGGPKGPSLSDHDPIVIVLAHRRGATQPRPPSPPLVLVPPSRDAARYTNRLISPSILRLRTISDGRSVLAEWEYRNEDNCSVDGNGPARLLRLSNPGIDLTLPFEFQRRPIIPSTSNNVGWMVGLGGVGLLSTRHNPSSVMNDLFVARLGVEGTRGRGMR